LQKGEALSPPFEKGRMGGIFKILKYFEKIFTVFNEKRIGSR
jgi:hypothetical protein